MAVATFDTANSVVDDNKKATPYFEDTLYQLIEAVNELQAAIESLDSRVTALEP